MRTERKVKIYIIDAVIELLKEKELKKIKITELCERANVSRMSFYRNYNSVESVMLDELDNILLSYKQDYETKGKTEHYYDKENILHCLQYMEKYKVVMKGLYLSGYTFNFLSKLNTFAYEKWKDTASIYDIAVFIGIVYNVSYIWAKNEYKESIDTLVDLIHEKFVK